MCAQHHLLLMNKCENKKRVITKKAPHIIWSLFAQLGFFLLKHSCDLMRFVTWERKATYYGASRRKLMCNYTEIY